VLQDVPTIFLGHDNVQEDEIGHHTCNCRLKLISVPGYPQVVLGWLKVAPKEADGVRVVVHHQYGFGPAGWHSETKDCGSPPIYLGPESPPIHLEQRLADPKATDMALFAGD